MGDRHVRERGRLRRPSAREQASSTAVAAGTLTVRQRLKSTPIDHRVAAHIRWSSRPRAARASAIRARRDRSCCGAGRRRFGRRRRRTRRMNAGGPEQRARLRRALRRRQVVAAQRAARQELRAARDDRDGGGREQAGLDALGQLLRGARRRRPRGSGAMLATCPATASRSPRRRRPRRGSGVTMRVPRRPRRVAAARAPKCRRAPVAARARPRHAPLPRPRGARALSVFAARCDLVDPLEPAADTR